MTGTFWASSELSTGRGGDHPDAKSTSTPQTHKCPRPRPAASPANEIRLIRQRLVETWTPIRVEGRHGLAGSKAGHRAAMGPQTCQKPKDRTARPEKLLVIRRYRRGTCESSAKDLPSSSWYPSTATASHANRKSDTAVRLVSHIARSSMRLSKDVGEPWGEAAREGQGVVDAGLANLVAAYMRRGASGSYV